MMEMMEMFEEVLGEVMDAHNCDWYQVVDSDLWSEVTSMIAERCGEEALESEEFSDWESQMMEDL